MTEKVKKGDFIELEYTGALKELGLVFDSTNEAVAKKEGFYNPKMAYGSIEICVGEGQILTGLDESIIGLEMGKEHTLLIPPEKAFGKKDGKLLKLVPTSVFKKQGINPVPRLQIDVDGMIGTIRTVTGGRTVVDFNHPFAGKEVEYKVQLKRFITDSKEKVQTLLTLALNQKKEAIGVEINGDKVKINLKSEFPKELIDLLKQRLLKVLPEYKEFDFEMQKKSLSTSQSKEKESETKKAGGQEHKKQ
jgi:FKBP-type peptidyl-prolyl cis-trans isomerase SlyD